MTQSIDTETLGERLRIARSQANLTQEASASALGVSRTTLIAIESGQRRARNDELLALANLYSTTVGHLVSVDSIHVDLAAKFRRIENKAISSNSGAAIALLNALVSGAVELERALGAELKYDYPPPVRVSSSNYAAQAEDAAISFRYRFGFGPGRIDDLYSALELDVGIRVFCRDLEDSEISGLYAFDSEVGACILVNSKHHWRRRMQTLAHEAGHFVSDRSDASITEEDTTQLPVGEKFARRFGAALLMPAPTVRSRFEQLTLERGGIDVEGLILLAHHFGVASEAMCRRLEELALLADGTWQSMRDRGFGSNHERQVLGDAPSYAAAPLISPRLAYLAARALRQEVLSEGQLCEMLLVDRVYLRHTVRTFQVEMAPPL